MRFPTTNNNKRFFCGQCTCCYFSLFLLKLPLNYPTLITIIHDHDAYSVLTVCIELKLSFAKQENICRTIRTNYFLCQDHIITITADQLMLIFFKNNGTYSSATMFPKVQELHTLRSRTFLWVTTCPFQKNPCCTTTSSKRSSSIIIKILYTVCQ